MRPCIRLLSVLCAVLLVISSVYTAFAHSGKTDSAGGHTDSSTGEYHYHHGYPAHQHINGKCPYDFYDQTNRSSGNSHTTRNTEMGSDVVIYFLYVIIASLGAWVSYRITSRSFNKKMHSVKADNERTYQKVVHENSKLKSYINNLECDLKDIEKTQEDRENSIKDIFVRLHKQPLNKAYVMPEYMSIVEDGLPEIKDRPFALTVYATNNGKSYHTRYCKLVKSPYPIHMMEAIDFGLKPCNICNPGKQYFGWYKEYLKDAKKVAKYGLRMTVKDGIIEIEQKGKSKELPPVKDINTRDEYVCISTRDGR